MSKYTPGPWEYLNGFHYEIYGGLDEKANKFGELFPIATINKKERLEAKTNACLIAAAPDLLEACKEICSLMTECNSCRNSVSLDFADQAIAKATDSQ